MRRPRRSRRSGRLRRFNSRRLLAALRHPGRRREHLDPFTDPLVDLWCCEQLAARAAEVGGGGSPCWGGGRTGPGEDLALVIEVSRALRGETEKPWHKVGPYISLS